VHQLLIKNFDNSKLHGTNAKKKSIVTFNEHEIIQGFHEIRGVRQIEIYTAEPIVPEPMSSVPVQLRCLFKT